MEKKSTELTRGEEEIMQILWRLGDAVVNEIIAQTEEPRPKYTTVATFLKILDFDGSLARMVSFFSRNEDISVKEMDEILEIMRNAKK